MANSSDNDPNDPEKPWYERVQHPEVGVGEIMDYKQADHEASLAWDQMRQKQHDEYEQELLERATFKWRRTVEEREILQMIKGHSPEVRAFYENQILKKRLQTLRDKDDAAHWKRIQPQVEPTLRDRISGLFRRERQSEQDRGR